MNDDEDAILRENAWAVMIGMIFVLFFALALAWYFYPRLLIGGAIAWYTLALIGRIRRHLAQGTEKQSNLRKSY